MYQPLYVMTKRSHHVAVRPSNSNQAIALQMFCKQRLTVRGLPASPDDENVSEKIFAVSTYTADEYRFHINVYDELLEHLKRQNCLEHNIEVHTEPMYEPTKIDYDINPSYTPTQQQVPLIKYLTEPGNTRVLTLQTGKGKTYCTLAAIHQMGVRAVCVVKGMYVQRWLDDVTGPKSVLRCAPEEVRVVRGYVQLSKLIKDGLAGNITEKFIIITNGTLYRFYDHYRLCPTDTETYRCKPEELFKIIGAGVRVNDEVHQDFHLNFKQDLFSHIPKTILLSATLEADNKQLNRMYSIMMPDSIRPDTGEYHKYIAVGALFYNLSINHKLKWKRYGRYTYSHTAFEESILKSKVHLENYLKIINRIIAVSFMPNRKEGQKLLVFASTKVMCTKLRDYLAEIYPNLVVNRYISEDDYSFLVGGDIIVSTLLSSGTAVDVPDLKMCIMSTAVGSLQSNIQALGRLRVMKKWPDETPVFYYMVCSDIQSHLQYHTQKLKSFSGKVLHHKTFSLNMQL